MSTQKTRPAGHDEDQDTRTAGKTGSNQDTRHQTSGTQNTGTRQDEKQGGRRTDEDRDRERDPKSRNEGTANDPSRVDRTGDPERKNDPTRIPQTDDDGPDHAGAPRKGDASGTRNKSI